MRTSPAPVPLAPPTIRVPVLLPAWPCAAPTATSLPFSITSVPLPRLPTTRVLDGEKTLATRSSPPSSVTVPWPVSWLPIEALQAVTCPVMPRFMPLMVSEPMPASPTVSRPLLVHSPPLTMTLPRPPADWPITAPPSIKVEATPRSSSVPVPAPPMTAWPVAVISSRLRTVPVLPPAPPMTRSTAGLVLFWPASASAPPATVRKPWPELPTVTCCWALREAPPVRTSAPPLSTTTADVAAPSPWAVMFPVRIVLPRFRIWPTAPSPVAVLLPAANRAVLRPPGGVVEPPMFQLATLVKSLSPAASVHWKIPPPLLSTVIAVDPLPQDG